MRPVAPDTGVRPAKRGWQQGSLVGFQFPSLFLVGSLLVSGVRVEDLWRITEVEFIFSRGGHGGTPSLGGERGSHDRVPSVAGDPQARRCE